MPQSVQTPPLYARTVRAGNLLFVSGQLPLGEEGVLYPGRVGQEVSVEHARQAAAVAARACLAAAAAELGSQDEIRSVVKIGGYVAVGEGFSDVPAVVDAASQIILDELGDRGQHARLAVGVASLPRNACVEIEMIFGCGK